MLLSGTSETIQGTTNEIAARLGQEYPVAASLIKLLKAQGLAKDVGTRKNPTGKGKGSTVYEVPATLTLKFNEDTPVNASATAPDTAKAKEYVENLDLGTPPTLTTDDGTPYVIKTLPKTENDDAKLPIPDAVKNTPGFTECPQPMKNAA